jgi:hypothetical protein
LQHETWLVHPPSYDRVFGFRLSGRPQLENDGESIAQSSARVGLYDAQQITSSVVVGLGGRLVYPSPT